VVKGVPYGRGCDRLAWLFLSRQQPSRICRTHELPSRSDRTQRAEGLDNTRTGTACLGMDTLEAIVLPRRNRYANRNCRAKAFGHGRAGSQQLSSEGEPCL